MRHSSLVSLAQPAIYVALRKFQSQKPTTLPCRPRRAQARRGLVSLPARRPQSFTFIRKRSATLSYVPLRAASMPSFASKQKQYVGMLTHGSRIISAMDMKEMQT